MNKRVNTPVGRRVLADLVNEFAAVRLSLDLNANGPRLLIEDLESGDQIFVFPLELSSFTQATEQDREQWLRVGNYRIGADPDSRHDEAESQR